MASVRGLMNRKLARRRLIAGAGGATAFSALSAACATKRGASTPAGRPAGAPKPGGTLIDARYQVLTGRAMDPDTETPTSNKMRRLWYQGLLGYKLSTYEIEPEVAQKW